MKASKARKLFMKRVYFDIDWAATNGKHLFEYKTLPNFAQKELRDNGYIVRTGVSPDRPDFWAIMIGE